MTIIHKGIRRKTTDVLDDYGQAHYCQNWRFKRLGEIGRRPGIGQSNMARMSGPVRAMITGNYGFPYLVQLDDQGNVEATQNPTARWTDPVMFRPDGIAGEPAAPVILSIVYSPASPQAYQAGTVNATATIAYDGLSGNLTYFWSQFSVYPNSPPIQINFNSNPGIWDFDAGCLPGTYTGASLSITTQFNGFGDFMPAPDFVVS